MVWLLSVVLLACWWPHQTHGKTAQLSTRSGLGAWIDPATPDSARSATSSRGERWELMMSDEFNTAGRSFKPGRDHIWTSIDKPDGVNAALEVYGHNMTSTECNDDGDCYMKIQVVDQVSRWRLWNDYQNPPGYKNSTFFYRSGMIQSWNKFCFQGGLIELRAQLPGAVGQDSGNPDVSGNSEATRVVSKAYYPTWPGIWMMGNLARAIFSASSNRMWPFSYNECDENVFASVNQRISACDSNPGHGLNPRQGRGAPEIDILEGAGHKISSSIQVAPGMPAEYRTLPATNDSSPNCVFDASCKTLGANIVDVPTKFYSSARGHKSWYQGLRYAANNKSDPGSQKRQKYSTIKSALEGGITENTCGVSTCPASMDPHADISPIDTSSSDSLRWGINSNGTCFPIMNGYSGAYLCSPGNPSSKCKQSDVPQPKQIQAFEYQMDAISADWPVHVGAYTTFQTYQVEWVMGNQGYIRWMLDGAPLFEIPASTLTDPPQNSDKSNPRKIMIEEPMYLIMNVAVSSNWGAQPPNPNEPCRGINNDKPSKVCDAFPMSLKVDYIRLYQDTSTESTMAVGCDPVTHPTKQWIHDHQDEFEDAENPIVEVVGKGFCRTDDDCTIAQLGKVQMVTGQCVDSRCRCVGGSWTGPRCTMPVGQFADAGLTKSSTGAYGPPFTLSLLVAGLVVFMTAASLAVAARSNKSVPSSLRPLPTEKIVAAKVERDSASIDLGRLSSASSAAFSTHASDSKARLDPNYATHFV